MAQAHNPKQQFSQYLFPEKLFLPDLLQRGLSFSFVPGSFHFYHQQGDIIVLCDSLLEIIE